MFLHQWQTELAEKITTETVSDLVTPTAQLSIYQNNIMTALQRALRNSYPLIRQLVGEDFFEVTAKEYIHQYPSRSGDLYDYGEYFCDFLATYSPLKNLSYLPEVAQFEWMCHVLLTIEDVMHLNPDFFAAFSPTQYDTLFFSLNPACRLMKCHYPLPRIIQLCTENPETEIDLSEGGANLLLIRHDDGIRLINLQLADYVFLNTLTNHQSLKAAQHAAFQHDRLFQAKEKVMTWIYHKIIVDCHLNH